jgi:phosphoglucosamine mutase
MRSGGFNLGGEQSGHIVMTDYATTGDGLMAALQFLGALVQSGLRASELANVFEPVPQLLKNVRFEKGQTPLDDEAVQTEILRVESVLSGRGRLLIRKSGTEPLVRVMAECEDEGLLHQSVDAIVSAIEAVL